MFAVIFASKRSIIPLGPIQIHLYGLIFTLSLFAGFLLAKTRARVYNIKPEEIEEVFPLTILLGILFARIYHLFHYFSYYRRNFWEIFALWEGGLGIFGGIFGGVLGIWLWSKKRKKEFWKISDLFAPPFALGQAIGRWGNFFNQEAFGPPTKSFLRVFIAPEKRPGIWIEEKYFHPLFLYESLLNLGNCLFLLFWERKKKAQRGVLTSFYFLNYGIIRFFLEFLRFDTAKIGKIKIAHLLSLGLILFALYFQKRSGIIQTRGGSKR